MEESYYKSENFRSIEFRAYHFNEFFFQYKSSTTRRSLVFFSIILVVLCKIRIIKSIIELKNQLKSFS